MIGVNVQPEIDLNATLGNARIDALYVHVPFCFHKCHYCDFYSLVDEPAEVAKGGESGRAGGGVAAGIGGRQGRFTERLIHELRWATQRVKQGGGELQPRTIFVGGGTPTLLAPLLWRQLLDAMRTLGLLDKVEEFTVEANPETVTAELADTLVAGGVNRVSIGAQSFDPVMLKALERWHEPARVAESVNTFRGAGVTNVNIDLIFAIPGQTMEVVQRDLDAALAIGPTHVSYYSLIFEPNTPLTQRMKMGFVTPMDEETERAMYEHVIAALFRGGFEHYEISNWSQPGKRCAHNMLYWHNANWLGVGPAAASHVDGVRWKNEPHLGRYLASRDDAAPPTMDVERLDASGRIGEQLMLRLRLIEGAPQRWVDELLKRDAARRAVIDELIAIKMLEHREGFLRLTRAGLFVGDAVLARLV